MVASLARGFRFVGALLVCGLGLAGCSAGFGFEAEGVSVEGSPAVATAESSVESPAASSPDGATVSSEFKRPRDLDGKPIWPDGVVGRGYVIPPQHKDAPPLPQWVKDFNPEMPEAARQPTEAGAKAFAEYAFASDFYEFNTGTVSLGLSINEKTNVARLKQLDEVSKQFKAGAWGRIDWFKINSVEATLSEPGIYIAKVNYSISSLYNNKQLQDSQKLSDHDGYVKIQYEGKIGWQIKEISFTETALDR